MYKSRLNSLSVAALSAGIAIFPMAGLAQDIQALQAPSAAALTQVVELRSSDGLVSLEGVILRFDESLISVKTSFGTIGIETSSVTCHGAACPPQLVAAPAPEPTTLKLSAKTD